MAAPKGNQNAASGRRWREALTKALLQYEDKSLGIQMGQALFFIANQVVKLAVAGDKDAIQEVGNRLDGKPAQALEHSGLDGMPLHVFEERFVRTNGTDPEADSGSAGTPH